MLIRDYFIFFLYLLAKIAIPLLTKALLSLSHSFEQLNLAVNYPFDKKVQKYFSNFRLNTLLILLQASVCFLFST